jgi:hypothetical protein
MEKHSHYPNYDVMDEKQAWDKHTQSIVAARLIREHGYEFFNSIEAEIARSICALLIDDHRADIIQYMVCHADEALHQSLGEGQRKPGIPKVQVLVREGLQALDRTAMLLYVQRFFQLESDTQKNMLTELSEGRLSHMELWNNVPQKAFFQKMLTFSIEAYYSHPIVWSEMGYGGPAYPRGYIRTAIGQIDPWEAKNEDDTAKI